MRKPSVKSLVGALLIALLISATQPIAAMIVIPVCVVPIFIAILYAWAGWIPAAVTAVGAVGVSAFQAEQLLGASAAWIVAAGALIVLVLPGLVGCVLLEKKVPFFKRMAISILTQTAAFLGCLCVVYLGFGIDLVDALVDLISAAVAWMSDEVLTAFLQNLAATGMLNEEAIELLSGGVVTGEQLTQIFEQAFDTMRYLYKQTMPAIVLNSGLLSGVLTTMIPGLICARRGDSPETDYVPISGWFMPSRAVSGLAVCMIASYALQWMEVSGAEAVTMVFGTVGGTMLVIQGIAAISRGLKQNGMKRGKRIAMIVAGLVFAYSFIEIAGAASALFGRKGAVSCWVRRKMEEKRKDDDEQ